jgi:hypothetical protein
MKSMFTLALFAALVFSAVAVSAPPQRRPSRDQGTVVAGPDAPSAAVVVSDGPDVQDPVAGPDAPSAANDPSLRAAEPSNVNGFNSAQGVDQPNAAWTLGQQLVPAADPGGANWYHGFDRAATSEEARLATQADRLARQFGAARSDVDKEKAKSLLAQVLDKQFDLRQRRQFREIESLEQQVRKLRELVQKRQENRGEIVSKRLDQILRNAQGLGW